jgi:hypothetical protein
VTTTANGGALVNLSAKNYARRTTHHMVRVADIGARNVFLFLSLQGINNRSLPFFALDNEHQSGISDEHGEHNVAVA